MTRTRAAKARRVTDFEWPCGWDIGVPLGRKSRLEVPRRLREIVPKTLVANPDQLLFDN